MRELFEDVRASTRATIEAELIEVTAPADSMPMIPDELLHISNEIMEELGHGAVTKSARRHRAPKRWRVAAWTTSGVAIVGIAAAIAFQNQASRVPPMPNVAATAPAPGSAAPVAPAATSSPESATNIAVVLSASAPHATLYLDKQALASNPFTAHFPVGTATHQVRAEAPGFVPRTVTFVSDHGTEVTIALDPVRPIASRASPRTPAPAPASPPPAPAEPKEVSKSQRCNPPYTVDSDGIKHFRSECLGSSNFEATLHPNRLFA